MTGIDAPTCALAAKRGCAAPPPISAERTIEERLPHHRNHDARVSGGRQRQRDDIAAIELVPGGPGTRTPLTVTAMAWP